MNNFTNQQGISGKFSYQLDDVLKAHFLYRKTRPGYKVLRITTIILIVVNIINLLSFLPLFVITLVAGMVTPSPAFESLGKIGVYILVVFIVLLLVSIVALYQPITRYRIKRAFQRNIQGKEEYEFIVDMEGVSINLPDWKSSMGWTRIESVYQYDEGFLLVYNQGDYFILPKRAFSDEEKIDEFVKLVTKKNKEVLDIK